jgi:hypothetical protein
MSENNINNFQTLIEQRRIVKEVIKKSMLAIAVPDRKAISDYRPAGIMWEDLLVQIRKEIGGGVSSFEELDDTPVYAGNELKALRINAVGDALEVYTPTDLNTWSIPGVAFVSPSTGNDFTAMVGDGELPFQTLNSALAASNNVLCLPGFYSGTQRIPAGTYAIHFMKGVIMQANSRITDDGNTINLTITGELEFAAFSYGFLFTGIGSVMRAHVLKFAPGCRSTCFVDGSGCDIFIKADTVESNGNNGGGMTILVRELSTVVLEANKIVFDYWMVDPRSPTSTIVVRCPDITISAAGFAGGGFGKTLVRTGDGTGGTGNVEFDFMGGTVTNLSPASTNTFGIRDSTLITKSIIPVGNTNTLSFKNGRIISGALDGYTSFYFVGGGTTNLYNLKIISDARALSVYMGNNIAGVETINADNCHFESKIETLVGNGKIAHFNECTFKTVLGYVTPRTSAFQFYNINASIAPKIYFTNCNFQLEGGGGETFLDMTPAVVLGCVGSYSSEVLGAGATDTWGGLTTIPTLEIQKY